MQEPVKLTPIQNKFVFSKGRVTAFLAARAVGKTFATAYLIGKKMTIGESVLAVAPTYNLLSSVLIKDTLEMFRKHRWPVKYNKTEKLLVVYDKKGVEISRCYFRSADSYETIRGISNVSTLIFDEAAICDKEAYDVALACLRGEKVRNPQVYLVSTPRGIGNWFSNIYLADDTIRVHGTSYDNPYIDKGFVEMLHAQYGDDEFARQEIYAEIVNGSSHSVFTGDDIHALSVNTPVSDGKVTFALDVASTGSDYSVITVIVGGYVRDILKRKTTDDNVLLRFISEAISKHGKPDLMILDKTGLGNFLPSRFQQQWPDILFRGINFAEASKYEAYANKRAEMYFNLRNSIRKGLIAIDGIDKDILNNLEEELFALEFTTNTQRKIILTKKEDVVKKIGRSCDISDSVALATMVIKGLSGEQIRQGLDEMKRKVKKR